MGGFTKIGTEKKKPLNISISPALERTVIVICQKDIRSISSLIELALNEYIAAHYPDGVK